MPGSLSTLNPILRNKLSRQLPLWDMVLWGRLLRLNSFTFATLRLQRVEALLLLRIPSGHFSILLFLLRNQDHLCSNFAINNLTGASFLTKFTF